VSAVELGALLVVALAGGGVALQREPSRQIIALGCFGVALSILFVAMQAPEVALSELAVGAGILPAIYLAALVRTSRRSR
jgi:uncharacterized MnhB-related membrane protein